MPGYFTSEGNSMPSGVKNASLKLKSERAGADSGLGISDVGARERSEEKVVKPFFSLVPVVATLPIP